MPNKKIRRFFEKLDEIGLKVTYDDVRMYTDQSDVLPKDTDLRSKFTRNVKLNIPVASSPMDTVTTAPMAIALAEAGGIGVIHRGLTPEAQAKEVARVKHRLNGLIRTPITVKRTDIVRDVLAMREAKRYPFESFPIVDGRGRLHGYVSGSDFDFCEDEGLRVEEIMTPLRKLTTATGKTSRQEAYRLMKKKRKKALLLVENGKLAGMYVYSDLRRIFRPSGQMHNVDKNGQLVVFAAVGTGEQALARAKLLAPLGCDGFQVDTAHGDSRNVIDTVKHLKDAHPHIDVLVGNVSRGEAARRLADAGADGILVGQGPGAICTTRVIAGVGVPQVSALFECIEAVGDEVPVCADGGIVYSGDAAIALAVGASSVMLGRYLAGTEEAPGEKDFFQGRLVKHYRGMGSLGAMRDNSSTLDRYKQTGAEKLVPEGVEGIVDYQGPVGDVIAMLVGGLRSSLGYLGAKDLSALRERAEIFRHEGGARESHPHDIAIAKEAPNYRRSTSF